MFSLFWFQKGHFNPQLILFSILSLMLINSNSKFCSCLAHEQMKKRRILLQNWRNLKYCQIFKRVEYTLLKQNQSFSYYLLQIFEVDLESSSCKTAVPWFTMLYYFTIYVNNLWFFSNEKFVKSLNPIVIWQKIATWSDF